MQRETEPRPLLLGRYIAEQNATVRCAAAVFGVSKSTVHKDVTLQLRRLDFTLWQQVQRVLAQNKAERHLRGGAATREKYRNSRTAQ